MSDETKKKVLVEHVDKATIEVLVDIMRKNCNVSKNPILMSFGTIARFMVGNAEFRKQLLSLIGDILAASVKSDNHHVFNTGLMLGVNLTDTVDKEDVKRVKDVLYGSLLNAIIKIDPSSESGNDVTQKRVAIYTANNLLVHFGSGEIQDKMEFATSLINYSIRLLDSGIDQVVGNDVFVSLAKALDHCSSRILTERRKDFKVEGIDTEQVVRVAERLETSCGTNLSSTLELVLE